MALKKEFQKIYIIIIFTKIFIENISMKLNIFYLE
jgi:hypothetical protein